MFSAKNRSKTYQIIEKCDNFENQPSCKGFGPCKGYSLCKMLSLGQKLKMPKTCKKLFPKNVTGGLCKNRWKKHQIFEKWDNFENQPSCKGYSAWKGYSLGKMLSLGQKFKMPKTCEKLFYKNVTVCLCKNHWKKHQILGKWDNFENRSSCKGYSPRL